MNKKIFNQKEILTEIELYDRFIPEWRNINSAPWDQLETLLLETIEALTLAREACRINVVQRSYKDEISLLLAIEAIDKLKLNIPRGEASHEDIPEDTK